MKSKLSTHSMIVMALFAALLCVSAYINLPLPSGHITLQTFMVLLIAFLFPVRQAVTIIFIYLLLGAVGLPVFAGASAGISYLLSSLGGYSFAFLFVALFLPLTRGKEYRRIRYSILAIMAVLFIDAFGAMWLMLLNEISPKQAFLLGFLPYIPLDLVKAVTAAQLVPSLRKIIVSY